MAIFHHRGHREHRGKLRDSGGKGLGATGFSLRFELPPKGLPVPGRWLLSPTPSVLSVLSVLSVVRTSQWRFFHHRGHREHRGKLRDSGGKGLGATGSSLRFKLPPKGLPVPGR
jgi:hypothetical protein